MLGEEINFCDRVLERLEGGVAQDGRALALGDRRQNGWLEMVVADLAQRLR
jgi:hypothetical protein